MGGEVDEWKACEGTYMVLILQLRRLDLLELLRQGGHYGKDRPTGS